MAEERGIPVFTISAGRRGLVPVPYFDESGKKRYRQEHSEMDEDALHLMAVATGGKFFRGHDSRTLVGAFNAISEARPVEFDSRRMVRTAELFPWLAVPGAGLLLVAALMARPIWRRPTLGACS